MIFIGKGTESNLVLKKHSTCIQLCNIPLLKLNPFKLYNKISFDPKLMKAMISYFEPFRCNVLFIYNRMYDICNYC